MIGLSLAGRLVAQGPCTRLHAPRLYKVGQRVDYVEDGKWFMVLIVKVASDDELV